MVRGTARWRAATGCRTQEACEARQEQSNARAVGCRELGLAEPLPKSALTLTWTRSLRAAEWVSWLATLRYSVAASSTARAAVAPHFSCGITGMAQHKMCRVTKTKYCSVQAPSKAPCGARDASQVHVTFRADPTRSKQASSFAGLNSAWGQRHRHQICDVHVS